MNESNDLVYCGQCGTALSESASIPSADRCPCPTCGSLKRNFSVSVHDRLKLKEKIGFKHKRPGFKKPIYESVSGDDQFRKTGQWNKIEQIIDREHDHYYKRVINPETGEIIRECNEPLSKHINRGSAKNNK